MVRNSVIVSVCSTVISILFQVAAYNSTDEVSRSGAATCVGYLPDSSERAVHPTACGSQQAWADESYLQLDRDVLDFILKAVLHLVPDRFLQEHTHRTGRSSND